MNKKIMLTLAVAVVAGLVMARPGPGGFHHGGFHHGGFGGPRFHPGGFGGPRYHHHHHGGWGWGLGAAGLALGTAAVVRDIVAPRTVVYSSYGYGTPVYTTYPGTYVAPAVYPAPVVTCPPPPPPVVYPRW